MPLHFKGLKCHIIMPGNDFWNSVCFSCCRKANVTLSGSLFQNCAAATGDARPPTVDSLNGGICRRFDRSIRQSEVLVDQARWRHAPANWDSMVRLHDTTVGSMTQHDDHYIQWLDIQCFINRDRELSTEAHQVDRCYIIIVINHHQLSLIKQLTNITMCTM